MGAAPKHWFGENPQQKARIEEYLSWQQHNIRAYCSMYFHQIILIPQMSGEPPNQRRVERFKVTQIFYHNSVQINPMKVECVILYLLLFVLVCGLGPVFVCVTS